MCILTPTDYFTTILHPSLVQLTVDSDNMIKRGWQPVGGPIVTPSGKFAQCFQKPYIVEDKTKKSTKK